MESKVLTDLPELGEFGEQIRIGMWVGGVGSAELQLERLHQLLLQLLHLRCTF